MDVNLIAGNFLELNHSAVCAFLSLIPFPVFIEEISIERLNFEVAKFWSLKSIVPSIFLNEPEGSALLNVREKASVISKRSMGINANEVVSINKLKYAIMTEYFFIR